MIWLLSLIAALSILPGVSSVMIDQKPLISGSYNEHKANLQTPCDVLGDRCFSAVPVAEPCYSPSDPNACGQVSTLKTNDTWVSGQPGGYFYGNWASCQAKGQTCAYPIYPSGVIPENATCYQGSVPPTFMNVSSPGDIAKTLAWAGSQKVPLVIKNTGHDWKGRSAGPDSIALWMHNLRSPEIPITLHRNFTPKGCAQGKSVLALEFGAGETWGALYEFAERTKLNLTVLGGTCGTVGVAGWLQGGGHSPLTPIHGMGVDNVLQFEVVLPSSPKEITIANECTNEDLFLALRGGGGGTFGVVWKIVYRTLPKFEVQQYHADLPISDVSAMEQFFEIATSEAINWSNNGWGGYIKTNVDKLAIELVNPSLDAHQAELDMASLTKLLNDSQIRPQNKTQSSWYNYFVENLQPPDKHIGAWSGAVASRLLPPSVFTDEAVRALLVDTLLHLHKQKLNLWLMLVTPTLFPHTTKSALHPSWKDAIWSVRINDKWDQFHDLQTGADNRAHFMSVHKAMDPIRELAPGMGVSINEADIWEPDSHMAFWGQKKYDELMAIKNRVDPHNVLTNHGAVNWDKKDERYRCYPEL